MHPSSSTRRRNLRFNGPMPSLLQSLTGGGPLYIHARNWMAELATIKPLTALWIDEETGAAHFPEQALSLDLGEVAEIHGVPLDYRANQALALEFATRGEPRSVSIVAIPNISDMDHFTRCLHHHPAEVIDEQEYQSWRNGFVVQPTICPCCQAAADERRAHAETNPLSRIFYRAIDQALPLYCNVVSPVVGLGSWLTPQSLQFSNGVLGAIGGDGRSMLEVDFGMCHTMRVVCRLVDDEAFSEISLYDSLGTLHLKISARGWEHEAAWRWLCEEG